MRTALQAAFGFGGASSSDETRAKREKIERELRRDERSVRFFQRLRVATSRIDLRAPDVFAEESFPDANIVAEYLDRADISPEIVAEYEKVCWESPEILAEVGCCFDFLTNALADASEPPVNCRRRLYYIAWEEAATALIPAEISTATNKNGANFSNLDIATLPESKCDDVCSEKRAKPKMSDRSSTQTARRAPAAEKSRRRREDERDARDSEIAKTLNAGRRAKRSRRFASVACFLCVVAAASYKTLINDANLNEKAARQSSVAEQKLVFSNMDKNVIPELEAQVDAENVAADAPIPLCPSTISRSDAADAEALNAEYLATLSDESFEALASENGAFAESSAVENFPTPRETVRVAASFDGAASGGGLKSSNLNKRPSIVIPAKNNDVFSKPLRF